MKKLLLLMVALFMLASCTPHKTAPAKVKADTTVVDSVATDSIDSINE